MKKRKLELYITGKLMSALMVGRPAIFSTGGEMYHTAPVVKIHETETQEIPHFGSQLFNASIIGRCHSFFFESCFLSNFLKGLSF